MQRPVTKTTDAYMTLHINTLHQSSTELQRHVQAHASNVSFFFLQTLHTCTAFSQNLGVVPDGSVYAALILHKSILVPVVCAPKQVLCEIIIQFFKPFLRET